MCSAVDVAHQGLPAGARVQCRLHAVPVQLLLAHPVQWGACLLPDCHALVLAVWSALPATAAALKVAGQLQGAVPIDNVLKHGVNNLVILCDVALTRVPFCSYHFQAWQPALAPVLVPLSACLSRECAGPTVLRVGVCGLHVDLAWLVQPLGLSDSGLEQASVSGPVPCAPSAAACLGVSAGLQGIMSLLVCRCCLCSTLLPLLCGESCC